jgi:hypothetical protein
MAAIAIDQSPPIVCVVVRDEAGDRVRLRGRIASRDERQGIYSFHVVKAGPAGTSNIKMGGPFTVAAHAETFVGLANFNIEQGATYTTDFSVTVDGQIYRCSPQSGEMK